MKNRHIYAILLLAHYMRGDIDVNDNYFDSIKYAIKKCADRYGMLRSTLYNQCTRKLRIKGINEFYKLSNEYLKKREDGIINIIEKRFYVDNIREEFLTLFE